MSQNIALNVDPIRRLAFGSIGAVYMSVGTAISNPARLIYISNNTDADLIFSFNGIDDHLDLPGNGYIILDVTANKSTSTGLYLSQGTTLYVKEDTVTPTSGKVSFTVFYGAQD